MYATGDGRSASAAGFLFIRQERRFRGVAAAVSTEARKGTPKN